MTAKLMILVVVLLMAFSSPVAAAVCWVESRDAFATRIFEKYGAVSVYTEKLKAQGLKDHEDQVFFVIEGFASIKNSQWLMISYLEGRDRLCLILHGSGWVFEKEA